LESKLQKLAVIRLNRISRKDQPDTAKVCIGAGQAGLGRHFFGRTGFFKAAFYLQMVANSHHAAKVALQQNSVLFCLRRILLNH